jgi:hypothetical protein
LNQIYLNQISTTQISSYSIFNFGQCDRTISGSRISYTKGLKSTHISKDVSEFAEAISLNVQCILFALEENDLHQWSKHVDPSMVSNLHWFGRPTDNPRRHRWKEEENPHLHIGDNKSKAYATRLSKTYPS